MKIYKIEVSVIDFDEIGEEAIKYYLEHTKYPNHCMHPTVQSIESRTIKGKWHDNHKLNQHDTFDAEYKRLFE